MPLTHLTICNFQVHSYCDVEFDPHLTVFTGPSDCGKSSIIRALIWVLTNHPGGDAFIRTGTKECEVGLTIDGQVVSRSRSKSGNLYYLNQDEFKSFGFDVPEPIVNLLNIGPVNIQQQHDAPYWFSDTAGQVSRNLNAVVDLDVIDRVLSDVASRLSKARTVATLAEERREKSEKELESLDWVEESGEELETLEVLHAKHASTVARRADLAAVVEWMVKYTRTRDRARTAALGARKAWLAGKEARQVAKRVVEVQSIVRDLREAKEAAEAEVPDYFDLEKLVATYNKVEGQRKGLGQLLSEIGRVKNTANNKAHGATVAELDLKEALDGRCPLCGTETEV